MFKHFSDKVLITFQGGQFKCTADEFTVIEPAFTALPEGIIERRYDPDAPGGKPKHILITARHNQTGGPVPWPEGDTILARAREYQALYDAAFPPPPPEPPPPRPTRPALEDGVGAVTRNEMNALKAYLRGE